MKNKLAALRIRLLVWWENAAGGKRAVVMGGGVWGALSILGLVVYGTFSYFRWNSGRMGVPWVREGTESGRLGPESGAGGPQTEASPINGVLYAEGSAEVFRSRRPLAIMVNNHTDARPQFGLSKADLIYEAVAEGGITRFLAIFHAQDCEKVGPVRSARIYYEDWAAEFHSWYAHWGGAYMTAEDKANQTSSNFPFTCNPAADAYAKINRINLPSLDQMWLGKTAYWRDNSRGVATEHTGYTSTVKLWAEAPNKYPGWEGLVDFDQWEFKDDNPVAVAKGGEPAFAEATVGDPAQAPSRGLGTGQASSVASLVSFNFWETAGFEVRWEYDAESNGYKRFQGGEQQVDAGAGSALIMAKNVILQFTREDSFGDKKHHLKYETVGGGPAKIFRDGEVVDANWKKGDVYGRTKFYDLSGQPIKFNRGQIWVEVVPERNIDTLVVS